MKKTLDDYEQLPEEYVRNLAATSGPGNTFLGLCEVADEWKAANCTPVFILASERGESMMIACVAAESFGKYLN